MTKQNEQVSLDFTSDLREQKLQMADRRDEFDRILAEALEAHFTNNRLAISLMSGEVFPIDDAKLLCVMNWNISHQVPAGIAAINAWQSGHWLIYASEADLKKAIAQAERKFSAWLKKGGLHDHNQYRSVNNCMEMPSDFMETEKAGRVWRSFSHLYHAWIQIPFGEKNQSIVRGFMDVRKCRVREQLRIVESSNPGIPYINQKKKVIQAIDFPEPYDWETLFKYHPLYQ